LLESQLLAETPLENLTVFLGELVSRRLDFSDKLRVLFPAGLLRDALELIAESTIWIMLHHDVNVINADVRIVFDHFVDQMRDRTVIATGQINVLNFPLDDRALVVAARLGVRVGVADNESRDVQFAVLTQLRAAIACVGRVGGSQAAGSQLLARKFDEVVLRALRLDEW